jgi:nickel/cobalt transporter (NicO) family protein
MKNHGKSLGFSQHNTYFKRSLKSAATGNHLGVALALLIPFLLMAYTPAAAHPADEGRQEAVFAIQDGKLHWRHDIWLGPLLGLQVWAREIDLDADQKAAPEEQAALTHKLTALFALEIDGKPVPITLISTQVAPYPKFVAQPVAPQISFEFTAPIAAGEHTLRYTSSFDTARLKLAGRFPSGGGVLVQNVKASREAYAADVTIKPVALAAPSTETAQTPTQTSDSNSNSTALSPSISQLLEGSTVTLPVLLLGLVVSFGVGAAHALTPGHGKGIIAAFMIGDRMSSLRSGVLHALILAMTMTVTHTASVIAIGLVAVALARVILPQVLVPWLTLVSGLMIVVVGAALLWNRARTSPPLPMGEGSHLMRGVRAANAAHNPALPHTHQRLKLADARTMSLRSLILLGISGGLLPCADALAILLLAISVNRAALGLVLLVAFSLGIAVTLTALGIIAASGQRALRRYNRLEPILARLPLVSAVVVLVLGVVLIGQAVTSLLA